MCIDYRILLVVYVSLKSSWANDNKIHLCAYIKTLLTVLPSTRFIAPCPVSSLSFSAAAFTVCHHSEAFCVNQNVIFIKHGWK